MKQNLPEFIRDVAHLEQLLSEPTEAAVRSMSQVNGDILLLGAGGKMGPSLARMIRRASQSAGVDRQITAVSRFSRLGLEAELNAAGVETLAGDLLDSTFVHNLPETPNIIFMTGAKFGTSSDAALTWAMNVWLPSVICQRFRKSRILAFSTGNVYPFVATDSGGSVESDRLQPVGEYGMSALGRERMFEYFSNRYDIPTTIVRLNYAVEMRYGVLVDLAKQILDQSPVDLSMAHANVIWQAEANAMALAALSDASSPPFVINVAGAEIFAVEDVCRRFATLFEKPVRFQGSPGSTALLNNADRAHELYGESRVTLDRMITWTADWLRRDGPSWSKPTRFEVHDGQF